ncbi:MAG: phosphoesterase, partial [Actinobacteria bacterium]
YTPTGAVLDRQLTRVCPAPATVDPNPGLACGDGAVNTIQPAYQPFKGSPQLPPQGGTTIGDVLTDHQVSWAWYSGGWSNADGDVGAAGWTNGTAPGVCADPNSAPNPVWPYCPNKVFQFHHQPFNYYSNYAPGTPGRSHLRDEQEFVQAVNSSSSQCNLDSVSFVKPIGLENEHPGYTSESRGSDHLVQLLQSIQGSA